jgi:CheY-like chemotaxis protein
MDLELPVLERIEATRRLTGNEQTKHIPIIVCTGVDPELA